MQSEGKGKSRGVSYTSKSAQDTVHWTGHKYLGSIRSIAFMIAQDQHGWSLLLEAQDQNLCCDKCHCPQLTISLHHQQI